MDVHCITILIFNYTLSKKSHPDRHVNNFAVLRVSTWNLHQSIQLVNVHFIYKIGSLVLQESSKL